MNHQQNFPNCSPADLAVVFGEPAAIAVPIAAGEGPGDAGEDEAEAPLYTEAPEPPASPPRKPRRR